MNELILREGPDFVKPPQTLVRGNEENGPSPKFTPSVLQTPATIGPADWADQADFKY